MKRGEQEVNRKTKRILLVLGATVLMAALAAGTAFAVDSTSFKMVANPCVNNTRAHADVTVKTLGPVEVMDVTLSHMPKRTNFDLFVIQQPGVPFGVSWYLGDMRSDANGNGHQRFIGRFSRETFAVAPGVAPAPVIDTTPIPDASSNPQFNPVHTLHLGLWFNSPTGGSAAGCPGGPTPFNGDHTAGVQALHTNVLLNGRGPLDKIH
jgi:hypothetical protein